MDGSAEHMDDVYASESEELDPWVDSPSEVSTYDWRDYLGNPRYQRAYVDFFEDQLVLAGYDLEKILTKYLLDGKEPLINNLIAGRSSLSSRMAYRTRDRLTYSYSRPSAHPSWLRI